MAEDHLEKKHEGMYQLLLRCGRQRTEEDFCCELVRELSALIPYNQARAIFLDESGRIRGARLFGVQESKWMDFLYYYDNDIVYKQAELKQPYRLIGAENKVMARNYWSRVDPQSKFNPDFIRDYVHSLRLLHAMGVGFCDQEDCLRSILVLERMKEPPFSEREVELLRRIHPLLENYFIDLLLPRRDKAAADREAEQTFYLTRREKEIVGLLMEALTPAQIGQRLGISVKTVNRHIANIYEKCHISNRQQLYKLFSGGGGREKN